MPEKCQRCRSFWGGKRAKNRPSATPPVPSALQPRRLPVPILRRRDKYAIACNHWEGGPRRSREDDRCGRLSLRIFRNWRRMLQALPRPSSGTAGGGTNIQREGFRAETRVRSGRKRVGRRRGRGHTRSGSCCSGWSSTMSTRSSGPQNSWYHFEFFNIPG